MSLEPGAFVPGQDRTTRIVRYTPQGDISSLETRFYVEDESFAPTAIGAATVETVQVTGKETMDSGYRVEGQVNGGSVAATGVFTYIAIKGATTGRYYAVAFALQINALIFTVPTPDKLNIVTRNSDAATAHTMTAYWQATRPGVIPGP